MTSSFRSRVAPVAAALALAAPGPASARSAEPVAEPRPYVFAVIPQAPPVPTRARWLPIVEALSRGAGVPLEMRLYQEMDEFDRDLAAGKADLAWVNPVQLIRVHDPVGYRPILRDERTVRGIFVVRKDSPYDSVASLAGREVAFIARWTFCTASLQRETERLGIVLRFAGTAANAYKQVILGEVAAAGVLDASLQDASPEIRAELRVVYETPAMAAHALVVHPRVPAEVGAQLSAVLLALARETPQPAALRAVRLDSPVAADYGRDYAPLEQLLRRPDLPGGVVRRP